MKLPDGLSFQLHHVGHVVSDIASSAAEFSLRFGYQPVSAVIHDPLQTAYVQFLQILNPSSGADPRQPDPPYLELVAPDGPASKLAAAARKGGGLHHLCYTVDALESAIDRLSAAGLRLIAEPVPAVAFAGRRICWLLGQDRSLVELVERQDPGDPCRPESGTVLP